MATELSCLCAWPRGRPVTLDEQISQLEEDLRRLKIEFDVFFNGGTKRPPYDTKGRVETMIKRLTDDRTMKFVQRYAFNSLVARYNVFRELWRRELQDKEEGRALVRGSVSAAPGRAQQKELKPLVLGLKDPANEVAKVKQLFAAILAAKQKAGEEAGNLSYDRFEKLITEKTSKIKTTTACSVVNFSVSVEDGKVRFNARATRG